MNRLILLAATSLMIACQSPQKKWASRGVGLWEEKSPNVEAVTLRNADGTMRRKEIRRFDYAKDPACFVSKWQWRIRGNGYQITLIEMTGEIGKNDVGKTWDLRVLALDQNTFRYLSSDGAVVEERRIRSASNTAFDEARLTGL